MPGAVINIHYTVHSVHEIYVHRTEVKKTFAQGSNTRRMHQQKQITKRSTNIYTLLYSTYAKVQFGEMSKQYCKYTLGIEQTVKPGLFHSNAHHFAGSESSDILNMWQNKDFKILIKDKLFS